MKEFDFDFKEYCIGCGWCCQGESPYASKEELKKYNAEGINKKENESCRFLKNGLCSIYSKRPFDCRIFPIDLKRIHEKIMWILWENCPAAAHMNIDKFLEYIEKELSKGYSFQHILNHVNHDEKNLPDKYSKVKFKVLKEVSWPRIKGLI